MQSVVSKAKPTHDGIEQNKGGKVAIFLLEQWKDYVVTLLGVRS